MAVTQRLNPVRLSDGIVAIDQPAYVDARAFAATGVETMTIPSGANYVRIAGTIDFYYSMTGTAAVPADTDDGSACELVKVQANPEWRKIPTGATALSIAASAAGIVTASFFSA